jgi:hypothetical protein
VYAAPVALFYLMMVNIMTETGSRKETNVKSLNAVFVWIVIQGTTVTQ